MKKAKLIANIPTERFRSVGGHIPEIGDVVALDQGFTFLDGRPGCLVYGMNQDGTFRYEADVYESELGDDVFT